jgi:N-methylhydantoinase A/oxoprolinase/acetone carboxylase beta subunit
MDIVHMYEISKRMIFMQAFTESIVIDREAFNHTVEGLIETAKQDLLAEGLPVDRASFSLELDMLYGGQVNVKRASSPLLFIRSDADAKAVYDEFEKEFSESFSPLVVNRPGGVYLDSFVLRVTVPTEKPALLQQPLGKPDPRHALSGTRRAFWPEIGEFASTPLYSFEMLQPGNVVEGPAVIEAELTTVVVPPAHRFAIDRHGLGILEAANVGDVRVGAPQRVDAQA